MTNTRLALTLAALAAALTPASASAATLEHTAGSGPANEEFLVYRAGKGERNRVTVTTTKQGVAITDPGARIRRKKGDFGGCTFSRNGHRATCRKMYFGIDMDIFLGDRDDKLRFKGKTGGALGATARTDVKNAFRLEDVYEDLQGANEFDADVRGGPGNDDLGGTIGHDHLVAGPGRDRVDGGRGVDVIEVAPDGARDVLRGGAGLDDVTGASSKALTIDLESGTFAAGADADTLNSIERAHGGTGDDTMLGSGSSDGLFGGSGDDTVDGRGGPDYLGAGLPSPIAGVSGADGVDTLTGGAGDDVLDGREDGAKLTPTDQLNCGDGADQVIGRQDDLVDATCESSAQGIFTGDLFVDQRVYPKTISALAPVARTGDGDAAYEMTCAGGFTGDDDCIGRIQLEAPPVTGAETSPTVLGTSAQFTIKAHAKANVTVVLNEAGKVALAQPGARASVHVLMGAAAGDGTKGEIAEFGWQQVLGSP
jgi:Ca2+-binding RTX toxin-like protein